MRLLAPIDRTIPSALTKALSASRIISAAAALVLAATLGPSTSVQASSSFGSCSTCHGSSTQNLNGYGNAIRELGNSVDISERRASVQGQNSDGASGTNQEELNFGAQPGWTTGSNNPVFDRDSGAFAGNESAAAAGAPEPLDIPLPPATVGGNISGLNGSVTLQNNGGNNLTRSSNGGFTFSSALSNGSSYSVTVSSQPAGQSCSVSNGSGVIGTSNITNVSVNCVDDADPTFTVGGSISGLNGSVTLQNNGESLTRSSNGGFTFTSALSNGSSYSVTVSSQPAEQTCSVTNGSGTVSSANVTSVSVSCVSEPTRALFPTLRIGGSVCAPVNVGKANRFILNDPGAITNSSPTEEIAVSCPLITNNFPESVLVSAVVQSLVESETTAKCVLREVGLDNFVLQTSRLSLVLNSPQRFQFSFDLGDEFSRLNLTCLLPPSSILGELEVTGS